MTSSTQTQPPSGATASASAGLRLSVIINNHNYGRYLGEAIDSALAQTHPLTEVVVVDDGSTDDSRAVLDSYAARHGQQLRLVLKPNGGQASAFNAGMEAASGDVVIYLDADDRLHPATGERVVAVFAREPQVGRVQYVLDVVDGDGNAVCAPGGAVATVPADPAVLDQPRLRECLDRTPDDVYWQPTSGNAFRRSVLTRILPMPEEPYRICADYYLSNLTPYLGDVRVLQGAGGDYRVHASNGEWSDDLRVDRLRDNLVRTVETRRHARRLACRQGSTRLPADPLEVLSVSFSAHRLLSLRLAPERHPFAGDTRTRVAWRGVRSGVARRDRPPAYRMAAAGWFLVAAAAPRPWLPRLAAPLRPTPLPSSRRLPPAPEPKAEPRMPIVVVNYRTPAELRRCLASIPVSQRPETWVVDNASGDGSAALVSAEFPEVQLVASPDNLLFAGGATLGMSRAARSGTPFVLILNADVEIAADTVRVLAGELDRHPSCALVGPRVVGSDGELQPSAFPWPSPADFLLAEAGAYRLARRLHLIRRLHLARWGAGLRLWDHDSPRTVPWVLGCAFAVRRSAFDAVGGFDPRFPMYFEETDLCARLSAAGWSVRYTPATSVRHAGGASTRQVAPDMSRRMYRSLGTYTRVHAPGSVRRMQAAVLAAAAGLSARLVAGAASAEGRRRVVPGLRTYGRIAADAARGWTL